MTSAFFLAQAYGAVMPTAHPPSDARPDLSVNPVFTRQPMHIPRFRLPDGELDADVAYQIVHDELMLDGNARLNLATFVTTWAEPQARLLMAESLDKNMIDKDEYPRTADLENRCVHMLADLWHAPDPEHAIGCSTTGSSEACMLGGPRAQAPLAARPPRRRTSPPTGPTS